MDISPYGFLGGVLLGLASSLHCAGMCGGIATSLVLMFEPALPMGGSARESAKRRGRVLALAQAGRVSAYMLAGGILGFAGAGLYGAFNLVSAYRVLQWAAAVVLIAVGLMLAGLLPMPHVVDRAVARLSALMARVLAPLRTSAAGPYLSGLTWGIIPCPMVYGALFTAMLTGTAVGGMAVMAGFGLGTLPSVTATAFGFATLARIDSHGWARLLAGLAIAAFGASTIIPGSPTAGMLCAPPPVPQ